MYYYSVFPQSTDQKYITLVWVGLKPAKGKVPKQKMETLRIHLQN